MDDMVDPGQPFDGLGPQETVRVGDDANHHDRRRSCARSTAVVHLLFSALSLVRRRR
eukprot:TRINITY_DN3472_c0_g1_i1.p3 TRINITY_DN3472_c0_g1~~TRINITY_DN3472_c0_g1_i1.p3  ORF type:complete len:57 (+),score=6.88 TRINITY_DN3472_c0_g1_i1:3-173(+)